MTESWTGHILDSSPGGAFWSGSRIRSEGMGLSRFSFSPPLGDPLERHEHSHELVLPERDHIPGKRRDQAEKVPEDQQRVGDVCPPVPEPSERFHRPVRRTAVPESTPPTPPRRHPSPAPDPYFRIPYIILRYL